MTLLRDRVVLISGGTQGLGAAIARAAAREGALVAVAGRRREPGEALAAELVAAGAKALFVQADVGDVTQARACVTAAITRFGRVDSLVNAAGLTSRGTLLDTTPDLFDAHIAVNLKGPFFLMQAVVADLVAREAPGTIVNIISTSEHGGQPYLAPYVAAKAGLAGTWPPRPGRSARWHANQGIKERGAAVGAERERVAGFGKLEDGLRQAGDWYRWGPYVSERQWGTVREDYSADGNAWDYLPHDHARSRAYRWGEDGLAGFCDIEQRLCLGLALWNGRDPILKERAFGLTGPQGNHGEDVKEYWWYLDAIPSHAWNRWRYHYPQGPFPYQDLIDTNAARNRRQPEYELLDTGAFDSNRYWITEVHYAKADPDDLLMTISVTNAGPDAETIHVLPTAWFRNTWSWDGSAKPVLGAAGASAPGTAAVSIGHPFCGELELIAGPGPDGTLPTTLFCENETNVARLFGDEPVTPYPKDGINDHVISGAPTVNPDRTGTKCAFWYQVTLAAAPPPSCGCGCGRSRLGRAGPASRGPPSSAPRLTG